MELLRYGQSFKVQSRDVFKKVHSDGPFPNMLRVNFMNFGRGYERKSAFGVTLRWQDVESAIQAFSEMGHPEAIKLRNAVHLAKAAEDAGWTAANATPSN
ncbi:hypothetical protein [Bradyrhizobium sp. CW1]|uniref:hypothetical protein n=1 Tax=Bradyrhizobium sp. CW1 TaxID=2782686 RepID=UPI001FFFC657|nr:hypothetical protein [Bradyrhizobium sp. CW1]UPJ24252.1 hypothetical protein IVB54_20165 [Bradyrhizobium sp. CW1]